MDQIVNNVIQLINVLFVQKVSSWEMENVCLVIQQINQIVLHVHKQQINVQNVIQDIIQMELIVIHVLQFIVQHVHKQLNHVQLVK